MLTYSFKESDIPMYEYLYQCIKNDIIHQYSSKYFNQKTIIHLYEPDLIGYNIQLKNISFKKIIEKISFKICHIIVYCT